MPRRKRLWKYKPIEPGTVIRIRDGTHTGDQGIVISSSVDTWDGLSTHYVVKFTDGSERTVHRRNLQVIDDTKRKVDVRGV